jgi:predicted TIM-barrel fold metal-dependent hydrolase
VDRDAAKTVFEKVRGEQSIGLDEQQLLEDYLMGRVLTAAARNKRAMQIHTGHQQEWNLVANSDPLLLNPLLYSGRYKDARIVLLHGGYPYTGQSILLAKYFPTTVSLDLAWMPLFSPAAARRTLSEALDILDGSQLMIGTDAANLEETYGVAKYTRRVLAEVLAEKIESGFWTEEVALQAARRILYQNAAELYGLPPIR